MGSTSKTFLGIKFFFIFSFLFFFCIIFSHSGCAIFGGGSGPEYSRSNDYKVIPPTKWNVSSDTGESDYAYKSPSGGVVTVTSSCNRFADQSPEVLTKQVLIGTRNVKTLYRKKIQIREDEGLHSSLTATLDGVPFYLEVIVVSHQKCVFDFQMIQPKPISKTDREDFIIFAKSLNHGTN